MNCTKPRLGYWSGHTNSHGNQYLVFDKSKSLFGYEQTVACGGCHACRLNNAAHWSRRALDELRYHEKAFFGTFTYSPEEVPHDGSLNIKDFQDFMKRLRKNTGQTIRYIMCGEYGAQPEIGDKFGRPHYHALIYGYRPGDEEIKSNCEGIITNYSDELDALWQKGITSTGDLTEASAKYVSQYIMKKITGKLAADHYQTTHPLTGAIIDLKPEFLNMSTKPAIGKKFYEQYRSDMYPSDQKIHKGVAYGVPRYYDKLLEKDDPEMMEQVKAKRKSNALKSRADNTPGRLETKHQIMEIQQKRRSAQRNL